MMMGRARLRVSCLLIGSMLGVALSVGAFAAATIDDADVFDSAPVPTAVTLLRGTPRQVGGSGADTAVPQRPPFEARVIGTGNTLWYVDGEGRIRACWLSGTGDTNSLKVLCTR